MRNARRLVTACATSIALMGVGAPLAAADATGPVLTAEAVRGALPPTERVLWDALTDDERTQTLEILGDDGFGDPAAVDEIEARWDEVEVVEEAGGDPSGTRATARTHWYSQNWTILGITYTEIKTTIGFTANGSKVVSVNRCYGTYTNYVPLRSISSASWSESTATTATCKTEWSLGRPLQPTVTGVQGLRVSGDGVLLLTWKV